MMKRLLFSGTLLAGDVFAQMGMLQGRSASEVAPAMLIAGAAGLLLTLNQLAHATAAICLDHGDTYTV